jgi:hypothetical protein
MYNVFIKKGLKKKAEKKKQNHLRSNDYEVCRAVTRWVPNILDGMVLENVICLQIN